MRRLCGLAFVPAVGDHHPPSLLSHVMPAAQRRFGEGWEVADPNDRHAEKFQIWYRGGPQVGCGGGGGVACRAASAPEEQEASTWPACSRHAAPAPPTLLLYFAHPNHKQVDAEIIRLFTGDCEALLRGEYDAWQGGRPEEALAGILIGAWVAAGSGRR